jgi:hypothetical protein
MGPCTPLQRLAALIDVPVRCGWDNDRRRVKEEDEVYTAEIERTLPLLHLEEIYLSHGYRPSAPKALCIFLARLSCLETE